MITTVHKSNFMFFFCIDQKLELTIEHNKIGVSCNKIFFFLRIVKIVQDFFKENKLVFFYQFDFSVSPPIAQKGTKGEEGRVEVGIIKCVSWGQEPQLKVYEKTIEQLATTQTT